MLRVVEAELDQALPNDGIYEKSAIKRRWLQKFDEIAFTEFAVAAMKEFERDEFDPDLDDFFTHWWNGLRLRLRREPKPGSRARLEIHWKRFTTEFVRFLAFWGFVLFNYWKSSFAAWRTQSEDRAPGIASVPACVFTQIGHESIEIEGDDRTFVEFCKRGPITTLNGARRILVQSNVPIKATNPERVSYPRWPLFQLVQDSRPRLGAVLKFTARHFKILAYFSWLCLTCPFLCLLGRDFAFHALVEDLNEKSLIENLFIHGGNYEAQYLWMTDLPKRKFELHLVWYSLNVRWHVYRADPVVWDDPHYQYMKVDHHWVWVKSIIPWIESVGLKQNCHVVGPILWYLPEQPQLDPMKEFSVSVFDITPPTAQWERDRGFLAHYYNTENGIGFVRDVVDAAKTVSAELGRPIRVRLKHKRSFSAHHDRAYIDFVAELEKKEPLLEIVPPATNLFRLVRESSFAISVPYSSPVYVAACLGIPGVFYDTSESLAPYEFEEKEIRFVSGREQLVEFFRHQFATASKDHPVAHERTT